MVHVVMCRFFMVVCFCLFQNLQSVVSQEVEEEEIGALEEQWVIESLPQKYISLLSKYVGLSTRNGCKMSTF